MVSFVLLGESDTFLARKTVTAPAGQRSDSVGPHPTPDFQSPCARQLLHGNSAGVPTPTLPKGQ